MQKFDTDADCSVQENKSHRPFFFYPSKLTGPLTIIDQYIGSHYFHTSQSIKKTKTKLLRDGKGSSSRNVTGNKKRKIKNFLKRPQFMKKGCDAFSLKKTTKNACFFPFYMLTWKLYKLFFFFFFVFCVHSFIPGAAFWGYLSVD